MISNGCLFETTVPRYLKLFLVNNSFRFFSFALISLWMLLALFVINFDLFSTDLNLIIYLCEFCRYYQLGLQLLIGVVRFWLKILWGQGGGQIFVVCKLTEETAFPTFEFCESVSCILNTYKVSSKCSVCVWFLQFCA